MNYCASLNNNGLFLGIDEAGRGCLFGPLVICGVKIKRNKLKKLSSLGVKDSKLLKPEKRKEIYKNLLHLVEEYYVKFIPPQEIDLQSLTELCILKILEILRESSNCDRIYIDKIGGLKYENFIHKIKKYTNVELPVEKIVYCKKADCKYLSVAAASIIAKVIRDEQILQLEKEINAKIGSGYVNEKTQQFVLSWIEKYNSLPPGIRRKWKTVDKILQLELFP
jgi:ribonuclease HII